LDDGGSLNQRLETLDQGVGQEAPRSYAMLNSRFMEARMFKEVPNGFIFQLPPPTIFTPTEAVLVTASQRDEILAAP
jgi:hypothetical protein